MPLIYHFICRQVGLSPVQHMQPFTQEDSISIEIMLYAGNTFCGVCTDFEQCFNGFVSILIFLGLCKLHILFSS